MLTPCRWRDDEQSARHLLAVFAAGVKICKASGKPGRAWLGFKRQRIGENAHLPTADEETHLLLIEPIGTANTGNQATAAPA